MKMVQVKENLTQQMKKKNKKIICPDIATPSNGDSMEKP